MKIFEQLERRRDWSADETRSSIRCGRICDDVIAPNAAGHDRDGGVSAGERRGHQRARPQRHFRAGGLRRHPGALQGLSRGGEDDLGACASTGIIYATNFHGMKPLIDFGTEEQKQRLLPRIADGGLASLAITEPTPAPTPPA